MRFYIFIALALLFHIAQTIVQAQQTILDEIANFVAFLNVPFFNALSSIQNNFDDYARTLIESRHNFNMYGNKVPFVEADSNRTIFLNCLVRIRTSTADATSFLSNDAGSVIFSYADSTVTKIETDLNTHMDKLRDAVNSKTNITCISKVGITQTNLLYNNYYSYYTNLSYCMSAAQNANSLYTYSNFTLPNNIFSSLMTQMYSALYSISNRDGIASFLTNYCTDNTFTMISNIQVAATNAANNAASNLAACITIARTLLPSTVPYLTAVNNCS